MFDYMKWLIEKSRYLALIGVIGLIVGAMTSLFSGAYKTFKVVETTIFHYSSDEHKLIELFDCLDSFLVAVALIVIAISLYELFIGDLEVPDWMLVRDLSELKAKFSFVIIPILAVKFLQKLLASENALELLYFGIAIALVIISLSVFTFISEKEKELEMKVRSEEDKNSVKETEKRAADV